VAALRIIHVFDVVVAGQDIPHDALFQKVDAGDLIAVVVDILALLAEQWLQQRADVCNK
jgi:hypothetical protein